MRCSTALRQRKHYGTTGTRIFIDLKGTFDREVTGFSDDPKLGPATETAVREARMGDIIRPDGAAMKLSAEVIGTAPVERVDVLHGTRGRAYGAAVRGGRSRPPRARAVAGRRVSRPRPRDDLAGQAHRDGQPHRALRAR